MNIWSNLFNNNSDWKETLIKDLLKMSAIDGEIDENEIEVIFNTGNQLGIPKDRIAYIIKNFTNIDDIYPTNDNDKTTYIKAIYLMVMADNKIDENEILYLKTIAQKLKLDNETIEFLLSELDNQQRVEDKPLDDILSLKDVVKKRNNLAEGIFANINNDLNDAMTELGYSTENSDYEEKLILMSNAYARRIVAAGLVLQGVFSIQDFQHAQKMFQSTQALTIHTREFQVLALDLANQFILSYDDRLTLEILQKIFLPVFQNHSDDVGTAKDLGMYYSYEDILDNIP